MKIDKPPAVSKPLEASLRLVTIFNRISSTTSLVIDLRTWDPIARQLDEVHDCCVLEGQPR